MRKFILGGFAAALIAGVALAAGEGGPFDGAIKARQAHMALNAHNMGIVGAMAQGKMPYDADAAMAAARNISALARMDERSYWPAGSDSSAFDYTRALPKIWENLPDVMQKANDLVAAADELVAVAGEGQEALLGGVKKVGGACGACHKAYRKPK